MTVQTVTTTIPSISPAELAAQRAAFRPRPTPPHIKRMRHLLIAAVSFAACAIWVSLPLFIKALEGSAAPDSLFATPSTHAAMKGEQPPSMRGNRWVNTLLGMSLISTTGLALWTLVLLFPQELGHVEYRPEISVKEDGTGVQGPQVLKPIRQETEEQKWLVDDGVLGKTRRTVKLWSWSAVRSAGYAGGAAWIVAREGKGAGRRVVGSWFGPYAEVWMLCALEVGAGVALSVLGKMWAEERVKAAKELEEKRTVNEKN